MSRRDDADTGCLFPSLRELAARLGDAEGFVEAHERFTSWVRARPDLLEQLRSDLRAMSPQQAAVLAAGSREVTTHFAWRLRYEKAEPFSIWLHEYKPQRDWLPGYANTVHNHRYDFSTTVLAGGCWHEWFDVELDSSGEFVRGATSAGSQTLLPGMACAVTADRFHRIPRVKDGTATFLIKSRPVKSWSLSFDPYTRVSRRHVPVEIRVCDLAERL
jgi:hypothetical protein